VLQEGCKSIGERILSYKPYFRRKSRAEQNVIETSAAEKWKNRLKWK
jgi:hypothetical protein